MNTLTRLLKPLLLGSSEYCCLCLASITEFDTSFSLMDEVSINDEKTEELYEIISDVIGAQLLDSLTTKTVCRYCTEQTIKCYKYIERCRGNINKVQQIVHSFELSTIDTKQETDFNKLFVSIKPDSFYIDYFYDNNEDGNNTQSQFRRFQNILEEQSHNELNIEFELDEDGDIEKSVLKSLQISDILYDKNDLQNYKCKSCLKEYKTSTKLKEHYIRMHAPKTFNCLKCHKSYGSLNFLNRHNRNVHCTVVCSQCGKTYGNVASLRYHEQSHTRRLVCPTCGKVYIAQKAFKNHVTMKLCHKMRKSNAEAKFTCDYCGKRYSEKTALRVHIRFEHENGKSVTCNWCNKKFSAVSRLNVHMLSHTKNKNFECDICGGKYVSKSSLLYHTRTHTGETPYKCEHCDMAFLSISRRTTHMKRQHLLEVQSCDICHKIFKSKISLQKHRKKHFDVNSRLYRKPQVEDKVST